ncbi:flavin reductase family protein [Enterococcus sp.]|uniref:flavin reductase family protein n=1 Tax=Enterococcus sp. TaxID=35783 RepID=UPI0025BBD9A0|nr:flavin reductase family protein [Enterococcus sp.]
MIHLDPQSLTQRENYKLLIGSIIPRPVAVVTTRSAEGTLNIAPFSFFSIVSSEPAIVSIAVQRKKGGMKDTAHNLLTTKEAVIHILDRSNVAAANQAAALLPAEQSELTVANFTPVPSQTIGVPGLQEAKIRFETTLYQHIPIIEEETKVDLLLLKITGYQINEEVYEEGKINPKKLAAVSRLAGNSYAEIGEIFDLARPKEKEDK